MKTRLLDGDRLVVFPSLADWPSTPRYAACLLCAGQSATDFGGGATDTAVSSAYGVSAIRWQLDVRPPRGAETENRTANQLNDALSGIERDRRASDPSARAMVTAGKREERLALAAASIFALS